MQSSELSFKSTTSPEVTVDTLKAALFSRNQRKEYNAWLSSRNPARGFGKVELYPLGFKLASDELINHLGEQGAPSHLNDALLYSVFFGYRHYVELRLKNQIVRLSGLDAKAPVRKDHGLGLLWGDLRGYLEETIGGGFQDSYDQIGFYVQVLDALDTQSFSFRYPNADFPVRDEECEFGLVNLGRLKDHVAELAALMDKMGLY